MPIAFMRHVERALPAAPTWSSTAGTSRSSNARARRTRRFARSSPPEFLGRRRTAAGWGSERWAVSAVPGALSTVWVQKAPACPRGGRSRLPQCPKFVASRAAAAWTPRRPGAARSRRPGRASRARRPSRCGGTARAMNSWCSGARPPASQRTSTSVSGEEVALVGVEEVGRAGAVALARKLHGPLDLVALSLDPDALAADSAWSQYRPSTASAV